MKPVLKCKGFKEVRSDLYSWRCTLLLLLLRSMMIHLTLPTHDNVGTCRQINHGNQVCVFRWRMTWLVFFTAVFRLITQHCRMTSLKTAVKETMTSLDPCPSGKWALKLLAQWESLFVLTTGHNFFWALPYWWDFLSGSTLKERGFSEEDCYQKYQFLKAENTTNKFLKE